jgi:hypothetical protein
VTSEPRGNAVVALSVDAVAVTRVDVATAALGAASGGRALERQPLKSSAIRTARRAVDWAVNREIT